MTPNPTNSETTQFAQSRYRVDYYQKPHNSPTGKYAHLHSLYYGVYQEALEFARRASTERDEYCVIVDRNAEPGKGIVLVV